MTLTKPTPDGSITLHFRGDMEAKFIPFTEMESHRPDPGGLGYIIVHEGSRDFYPYSNLQFITLKYNSKEYREQYEAWEREDHQNHLSFDEDGNVQWLSDHCHLCYMARMEVLAAEALQKMGLPDGLAPDGE